MSADEFTKLFQYMSKRFDVVDQTLNDTATKQDVHQILKRLDSIEKQLEISDDERLVMGHQLDRLNRWMHEVANKIDYKLKA
jgi:hypothetical protein